MDASNGRQRRIFALAALLVLAAWVAAGAGRQASPPTGPKGNENAPAKKSASADTPKPLEVIDAEGYGALLAKHRGKPLMVTFWATWCEPCRDEYPMVNELARQYEAKGLAVFGVSLDGDAEETLAARFVARNHPIFRNYRKKPGKEEEFINSVSKKWSGALPATFLYSPDGRLVGQIVNEQPREVFVAAIEQLLATAPSQHTGKTP